MNSQNWAEKDIERGINYLADHEEKASTETILTAGDETTILLPSGLPAYGANITGMFMMAPLLLFLLILILFPIRILWSTEGLPITTVVLSSLCLLLAWGLTRALRLMLKNRDLFPRCYMVTLGTQGIAMHFSRFHLPFHAPRKAFAWKEILTVRKGKTLFLPALLFGTPQVNAIEVISKSEEKIIIPFRLPGEKWNTVANKIHEMIVKRIN